MKTRIKFDHWIPKLISKFFPISAVTIYPYIFVTGKKNDSFDQKVLITHERIHIAQFKEVGVLKFYFIYVKDYLEARYIGRSHFKAYRSIRFEREAYTFHGERIYLELRVPYEWKKFNVAGRV